ncbi:MAG: 3-dehydroquinate synthase [Endomicrobiia bacterium]
MKTQIVIKEEKRVNIWIDKIDLLPELLPELNLSNKVAILTHKKLWDLYRHRFYKLKNFKLIFLPEGEETKSIKYLRKIYYTLLKYGFDRKSILIIFGGGVIGDLGGFAAATFMRGIDYVKIPTTLLAMIDSSIGGKTAINLSLGKNLVGSFYQPKMILCDLSLTKTLPMKEFYTALGEILKYAILNKKIYLLLNRLGKISFNSVDNPIFKKIVFECIKTKLDIVKSDEKELTGLREKLNLGHTIAHGIEAVTKYKKYSHGIAVILGLVAETYLSYIIGLLEKNDFEIILKFIENFTQGISFNKEIANVSIKKIYECLKYDKKVQKNKLRFVLPKKFGVVKVYDNIPIKNIFTAIEFLQKWIVQR